MNQENETGIYSLNEDILTEFDVVELEERLETDPIAMGTAADSAMMLTTSCFTCHLCFTCGEFGI